MCLNYFLPVMLVAVSAIHMSHRDFAEHIDLSQGESLWWSNTDNKWD